MTDLITRIAAGQGEDAEVLCSDCPPVGYPTDKTRCLPCPRRAILRTKENPDV